MAERITIQDIADALGLSRNTVSKAINNTGLLAESTREKVLQKAMDMGYKQFSYVTIAGLNDRKTETLSTANEIAMFSASLVDNSHFASTMLDKLQRELSLLGYSFTMHRIREEEVAALKIPPSYNIERTAGIICVEMFDKAYSTMLCSMGKPILFVDSHVAGLDEPLRADCLYMENKEGTRLSSTADYREYLEDSFRKLSSMPDVFICANDFVALDALAALKKLGLSVPEDIWLCGFDDSPESKVVTPSLTTVHIHSQIMGFSATHLLLSRIKEPSLNFRTLHTETSLIYRESTGD